MSELILVSLLSFVAGNIFMVAMIAKKIVIITPKE